MWPLNEQAFRASSSQMAQLNIYSKIYEKKALFGPAKISILRPNFQSQTLWLLFLAYLVRGANKSEQTVVVGLAVSFLPASLRGPARLERLKTSFWLCSF